MQLMTDKIGIEPIGSRILVRPDRAQEMSSGGIYLPEQAQKKQSRGIVVALGPGDKNEQGEHMPLGVSLGDTVIYSEYAGSEISNDEETFVLIREADIFARIVKQ